ncbi:MAG TPA: DUF2953 domain-containing protein [Acetivibrio clariflavus]|uniref:DUF2953 domain-containing protein n=2 Tax=Acetivibrio clariflavus TaxID=288965 RepID=G8LTB7_ACECE|nr:Protein of unknown function (DUF2953) [Acetivibrio clariflavus DSM 19732]HOQ01210.1 DUF2953 domain-containing protein [Acetivibrio clariflavus]
MTILIILGYILAALIVWIILILIIPFEFMVNAQKKERTFISAKVIWLWGLFGFYYTLIYSQQPIMHVQIFWYKKRIGKNKANKGHKKRKQKDKEKDGSINYFDTEFLECTLVCIKKILKHLKPKKFEIEGTLGFEDPYITGIVCAMLNVLLAELKTKNIKINMVFDEEIYEGKGTIQGRGVLAYIAYLALRLYLSRPDKINQKPKFKEVNLNVR